MAGPKSHKLGYPKHQAGNLPATLDSECRTRRMTFIEGLAAGMAPHIAYAKCAPATMNDITADRLRECVDAGMDRAEIAKAFGVSIGVLKSKATSVKFKFEKTRSEPPVTIEKQDTETIEPEIERGYYEVIGTGLGKLVDAKQSSYGDAISATSDMLRVLYPNGVQPDQFDDMLLMVRVMDKQTRIARGDKTAFDESPWRDIAGYGLLGYGHGGK